MFEIILMDNDNFLRLMFAYTTSNVYLSLMFKFEIYLTNFRQITYPWPHITSVVMTIFVKLVLIHGLIQIVLMMTNYDLYY
jgi:succinate dehydrogenase/fumarate reductase cytochrome b subunit